MRRRAFLTNATFGGLALATITCDTCIGAISMPLLGGGRSKLNNPEEWQRWWICKEICCVNPFYPRDGRETVYRPYEKFARTDTVGGFLDVYRYYWSEPHAATYPDLPADFHAYLMQRIPEPGCLEYLDPAVEIDAFGEFLRPS